MTSIKQSASSRAGWKWTGWKKINKNNNNNNPEYNQRLRPRNQPLETLRRREKKRTWTCTFNLLLWKASKCKQKKNTSKRRWLWLQFFPCIGASFTCSLLIFVSGHQLGPPRTLFFSLSLSLSLKRPKRHRDTLLVWPNFILLPSSRWRLASLSLSLSLSLSGDVTGHVGWWMEQMDHRRSGFFLFFFVRLGLVFSFFFVHALNQQRRLDDGANDVSDERQRKDIAALKKNNNNTDRRRGRTVNWWDHQWRPGAHLLWMHWIACKNEENKTNKPNHNEEKGRERWFRIHKKRIDCVVVVSNRNNEGNGGKLKRKTRKKNSFRFSFFFF